MTPGSFGTRASFLFARGFAGVVQLIELIQIAPKPRQSRGLTEGIGAKPGLSFQGRRPVSGGFFAAFGAGVGF